MAENNALKILEELTAILAATDGSETEALMNSIKSADAVFVAGAGRSFLMMKAFAMRLMQIGLRVYVVGEIVTPAITDRDLLIIGSGSGETGGLALIARKASAVGASIALITANPESAIGGLADVTVRVHTSTEKISGAGNSVQPGGSAFEQSLLLLGDSIVMTLMEESPHASVMTLHANLE